MPNTYENLMGRIEETTGVESNVRWNLLKKRSFDLVICLISAPFWVPILILLSVLVLIFSGRPIFYLSPRRVWLNETKKVIKFRTMVRNAAAILNRDTVPVEQQRFLNLPSTSPLYTRIGRIFEIVSLTELPQILHVVIGDMSFVGNRPLPENVIRSLKETHNNVDERFLTKAGLTGPTQIMGRETISDETRLRVESWYSQICQRSYSWKMDFLLVLYTAFFVTKLRGRFSEVEMREFLLQYDSTGVIPR